MALISLETRTTFHLGELRNEMTKETSWKRFVSGWVDALWDLLANGKKV